MTWIKHITPLSIALLMAAAFPASAGSLPPLINFQSVLLDEGGNLLPSGPTTIQFQILDENRTPIYSESQSIEVVKGAAAALIGNGADAKGAATGGIPEDIFATGAPRYLQVQVGSHAPEDPMTIVPVPYSQWSATCATVADGGVKPASIAKAAVGFEALAPDVVSKLADAMSSSQGVITAQTLGGAAGATQVGVTAKFINSGSSSVQGVLQDIDLSVKKGQETDTFLTGKLNQEVTDRTNAVAGVQGKLNQEVKDRGIADTSLQNQINPILSMLQNINNIPGKLLLSHIEPTSSAISDLNMGGKRIINLADPSSGTDSSTKNYVDVADGKLQGQVNTINTTISNINNIPGVLDKSKLPADPLITVLPPILSGEIAWGDFTFYKYTEGSTTPVTANIQEGLKFIPFNESEILAQNTCSDASGHACNYATIPADNKLYHCKVGIKFNLQGHMYATGDGLNATCEYTTRIAPSSINDNDGGNLDYAVQRGILIHVYVNPKGFSASSSVSVLYSLYQIPVATQ